jgi:D-glycero-alpha-D-manno-heptose 1-phosphate guanylyltransferase
MKQESIENARGDVQSQLDGVVNLSAVLLVGGMGTRLKSVVPSTPKPLARVGDRSFLELLVRQLRSNGLRNLVMCTGYLADQIEEEFGDGHDWNVSIQYSKETSALGTAGALKLAESVLTPASELMVMNGDSFLELDFVQFLRFHRAHGGLVSIAVRKVNNAMRYGTVKTGADYRITGFAEKALSQAPGLVNGGIYLFKREVLSRIPEGPGSLEKDVFPRLLTDGMYAFEQHGMFIDIGTPEDYVRAQELCEKLYRAAVPANQPR